MLSNEAGKWININPNTIDADDRKLIQQKY